MNTIANINDAIAKKKKLIKFCKDHNLWHEATEINQPELKRVVVQISIKVKGK